MRRNDRRRWAAYTINAACCGALAWAAAAEIVSGDPVAAALTSTIALIPVIGWMRVIRPNAVAAGSTADRIFVSNVFSAIAWGIVAMLAADQGWLGSPFFTVGPPAWVGIPLGFYFLSPAAALFHINRRQDVRADDDAWLQRSIRDSGPFGAVMYLATGTARP